MPSIRDFHTSYESCFPCKFFVRRLWKSGLNPEYHTVCKHPTVAHDRIALSYQDGRIISEHGHDHRPEWCPIRGNAEAEKEAEHRD